MSRDALGEALVGAGCEIDGAAAGLLLLKEMQQLAVVRQMRDVEGHGTGDVCLECGTAMEQAARQGKKAGRMRAHQDQQGVDEGVGFDEGSVEVDQRGRRAAMLGCGGATNLETIRSPRKC